MDYERAYHEAKAELAAMKVAFKHYMAAVGEAEGVYFVDHIEDVRSLEIARLIEGELQQEGA